MGTDRRRAVMTAVGKLLVLYSSAGNFLTSRETVSFSEGLCCVELGITGNC